MHTEPPGSSWREHSPFVGRSRELSALTERLTTAGAGAGGVALVAGEPGIGKTRLLSEFAARARSGGWTVLSGSAYQADGLPPYLIFSDALRGFVRTTPPDEVGAYLGGGAADVALLVRELRTTLPDVPEHPPVSPELERYRLFESVAGFLFAVAAATPTGLLLVLDDLHWADAPSLQLLLHLSRRLNGQRVLIAGSYRDQEVARGHAFYPEVGELLREQTADQLVLQRLSEADVAGYVELAAEEPPAEGISAAVFRESEGNPLFMVELVRLIVAEGRWHSAAAGPRLGLPQSIVQVIGRRLDRLSAECYRVLSVAAVIGREFELPLLQRATDLDSIGLLDLLEEAESARVLSGVPGAVGRFSFTHPLIRETLYTQLLTVQRVRLHRRLGEALEALYGGDPDPYLAELAHHFYQGAPHGDAARAVDYARRAGDRSMSIFAYEESARLYQTALDALTFSPTPDGVRRCELLVCLADAQTRSGDTAVAKETFRTGAELAARLGLEGQLTRAALGYAGYRGTPGVVDPVAIELLEEALAALGPPTALKARVMARLAMELYYHGTRERREALSREAVQIARELGDPATLAAALVGRHYALHGPENLPQRLAAAAELIALAEAAGDPEVALQGHYLQLANVLEAGDGAALAVEIDQHEKLALELKQPLYLWRTDLLRTMQALLEGRFEAGEELARQALAVSQRAARPNSLQAYGTQIFVVRWEQGRLDEIEQDVVGLSARYPGVQAWRAALALLYSETGKREPARAEFDRVAVNGFADAPRDETWLITMTLGALLCEYMGDVEAAGRLYDLLLPYAERTAVAAGGVVSLGGVARYLGILAALMGRWEQAEKHFRQALLIHERLRGRPWLARMQLDYASMLLRRGLAGDRKRAGELIASVLATAAELVMPRLTEQARALNAQIEPFQGGRTRQPDGLSARELEVLHLLAQGLSNREIAADLVLSKRTIDHHIATIYRKVGARRRGDAVAYALRQTVTPAPTSSL
jgi:DNA-binding CsgD family transcriptional regulator/tetratricopeptide (TPR) repeat protein